MEVEPVDGSALRSESTPTPGDPACLSLSPAVLGVPTPSTAPCLRDRPGFRGSIRPLRRQAPPSISRSGSGVDTATGFQIAPRLRSACLQP